MNEKTNEIPLFSIVLAFRNEEKSLPTTLDSFDRQSISRVKWEIILVDGMSYDGSTLFARDYVRSNNNSRLFLNPDKIVTCGWNIGIENARGKYIIITSAHSLMDNTYMEKAKYILADNPGIRALSGRIRYVGTLGKISQVIAAMMNKPFAMGKAAYRTGGDHAIINQISYGIYERNLFDQVGRYDCRLKRCGDWEFSYRLHQQNVDIYFNTDLKAEIICRQYYMTLFSQQLKTGFWKARIWMIYPKSILIRQIIPLFYVLWLISLPLLGLIKSKVSALIWLLIFILYIGGILINIGKEETDRLYKALVFPVIHFGYGLGLLTGLVYWPISFLREKRLSS